MKHLYKVVLVFLCAFLLTACRFDVADNERIFVDGYVTDNSGNAIANIPVRFKVAGFILGSGITNEQGYYGFYGLKSNFKDPVIDFNSSEDALLNYTKGTCNYSYEEIGDRPYWYSTDFIVEPTATLQLTLIQNDTQQAAISGNINYTSPRCELYQTNEVILYQDCYTTTQIPITLQTTTLSVERDIYTVLGSTVTFEYTIDNGAQQLISIPVNNQNTSYEITF